MKKGKKFNITGLCIPEKHYMVDVSAKVDAMKTMVAEGDYFVINRPRQYGKTTLLSLLRKRLQNHSDFFPILISFEGISSDSYRNEQQFIDAFLLQFQRVFQFQHREDLLQCIEERRELHTLTALSNWIADFVQHLNQPVVLMIDEVDKSSNHQLFLDFLAMLRTKYLAAADGSDVTFHCVILAGVHDVKSLKLKLRSDDERKYNSPWNIAVDFTGKIEFGPQEIETMLAEYSAATDVEMDRGQIAEYLYAYTSGYPFLVSVLCKIIDETIHPDHGWLPEHVDDAANRLLSQSNTNFDHLIKHLEHHQAFANLVEQLMLQEASIPYNQDNPLIHLGGLYGILTCRNNSVAIHNRIYRERIYNYLTSKLETGELIAHSLGQYTVPSQFVTAADALNYERVLLKFQEFMKQEYSRRDEKFLERNGRLVFFAFLRPILNGRGFAFKEAQISEEKRLDVVITFGARKYVIELKVWGGDEKHQAGLRQLTDYLKRTGHDRGGLVIFDFTQKGRKTWKQDRIQSDGKDIFAVWV